MALRLAALLFFVGLAGCITPRSTSPSAVLPIGGEHLADRSAAAKEVEEARRMLEGKEDDTAVVMPRLVHVISKYPDTEAATEARYWLGVSYYRVQNYREAIEQFRQYIERAPAGRYANASAQFISKLTEEYDKRFEPIEKLTERIGALTQQLQAQPDNPPVQLELADALWKRGNYAEAGEVYATLVKAHPEYAAQQVVAERVDFQADNKYTVLSPEEVQRRMIEKEPLVLTSLNGFKSGRDLLTRERRYFVVSGQLKNRSDATLSGVQLAVTIYGFGGVVYDTSVQNIGRMNPGEVRAFSVQFSNFPELDDIDRYEAIPTFQR